MSELRNVSPSDKRLYEIESQVVRAASYILDTGSPESFTLFLQKDGEASAYLATDPDGEPVGYLALNALHDSSALEVRSIAVTPEFQRRHHGETMMQYAEMIARQAGHTLLKVVTSPENTGALRFYQKLGYTVMVQKENYYGDGTPRLILEKEIL